MAFANVLNLKHDKGAIDKAVSIFTEANSKNDMARKFIYEANRRRAQRLKGIKRGDEIEIEA